MKRNGSTSESVKEFLVGSTVGGSHCHSCVTRVIKTGSCYVALALAVQLRVSSDIQQFSCLLLLSAEMTDMHDHSLLLIVRLKNNT